MAKVYQDKKGYKRYSDSGKLVHRHVAGKKIGRNLRKGEVVHHKNRNKKDNRRSNLWVFSNQKSHSRAHREDAKDFGKNYSYKGKKKGGFLDWLF